MGTGWRHQLDTSSELGITTLGVLQLKEAGETPKGKGQQRAPKLTPGLHSATEGPGWGQPSGKPESSDQLHTFRWAKELPDISLEVPLDPYVLDEKSKREKQDLLAARLWQSIFPAFRKCFLLGVLQRALGESKTYGTFASLSLSLPICSCWQHSSLPDTGPKPEPILWKKLSAWPANLKQTNYRPFVLMEVVFVFRNAIYSLKAEIAKKMEKWIATDSLYPSPKSVSLQKLFLLNQLAFATKTELEMIPGGEMLWLLSRGQTGWGHSGRPPWQGHGAELALPGSPAIEEPGLLSIRRTIVSLAWPLSDTAVSVLSGVGAVPLVSLPQKSVKEGLLLKQTSSFQRWKRRYVRIRGKTLYYAKDSKSLIFDEVDLTDASVAETSTKNVNNSFTVITPFRKLILCAENRKEMEDWMGALKAVQKWAANEHFQLTSDHFSSTHNWYTCSHARPTFCNVCREALSGVTSHGLSCEVCKFKVHKRCAVRASSTCKWTTLATIGNDIIEDEDGVAMPHQWLEGNLPVNARCASCDRMCGSVRRLQDYKCLWCKAIIHGTCRDQFSKKCPLGQYRVSILPPTVLNCMDSDGFWKASCPGTCSSPLLAFVNSKSGDNQGVRFLRKFKQFLNPAQVFDLMNGGPHLGLRLFQRFSTFRILVCGGDGSVGWVLSEIDTLGLHKQCQLGVLPLGTGNDLARVLGWGSLCDDDTQLLQILEKMERATTKMLDRWSVLTWEAPGGVLTRRAGQCTPVSNRTDMLIRELEMEPQAAVGYLENNPLASPAAAEEEDEGDEDDFEGGAVGGAPAEVCQPSSLVPPAFKSKDQMVLRANSLKKALRQIIEQTEQDSRRDTVSSTTSSVFLDQPDDSSSSNFAEEPVTIQFSEKCVMNNYFGIGLDAKISLEFNNKRDEHPKKCSSRTKNMMWYGVLGTKELLQRTYKNLEQRVQLECDGEIMALPSLQGIAVLNIPSYAGGINFWGGTKEDNNFGAPSFDDKKLEVVAVFGSIQMAVSRVINLQHHRIAQCRVVKITICGDEGVPVQVDGEAWVQPPGIIKIQHKNRAQMLTRDRAFESTLKSWEDKQKGESYRSARPRLSSQQSMEYLTEEEYRLLQRFARSADILITRIREVAKIYKAIEQELAHSVNGCASALTEVLPSKRSGSSPESLSRNSAVEVSISVKALYNEARAYVEGKLQLDSPRREEGLQVALANVSQELEKVSEIHWMAPILNAVTEEESLGHTSKGSFRLRLNISKGRKSKPHKVKWSSSVSGFRNQKGWPREEDSSRN
ncbi:diacylglycerol kinase kappa [Macrotis lagotis]|uniref:diacylglycerol kinase kappa n=1 Tax=Macrotis lagotis TaxID=92651 RepID=UPI003D6872DC